MEEYEDYYEEEYQQEEEEEEEEEKEKEERKPSAEELEYLELRKRIKEQIRKKMNKDNASSNSNSKHNRKPPSDNFGSFFGPSQPVIAQRVIQESKSLLENPHLAVRVANGSHGEKKSTSTKIASTSGMHQRPSSVKNEVKVQKLKDTRDYSFLLSDDATLTASKEPQPRNLFAPKSEVRSTQVSGRIKQPSGGSRNANGGREERKASTTNGQMHSKVGVSKMSSGSKSNSASVDSRRPLSSNVKVAPIRPAGREGLPSKTVTPEQKRSNAPSGKNSVPVIHRQLPLNMQPSVANQRVEQRKPMQEHRAKVIPKQPVASSKPQVNKPASQVNKPAYQVNKPAKSVPLHASKDEKFPKKKPDRQFSDDEDEMAFSMIRKMFNVQRYAGRDDDDSDMEANFDDIMREEKRSAQIGRKEDEEQLRLIEEEERRERMRKMAKKRKLGH